MEKQEFLNTLSTIKNGHYCIMQWESQPHVLKAFKGSKVQKISTGVVRIGVAYNNIAEIQTRTATTGAEPSSLPYGHYVDGLENILIEHKDNFQVRITKAKNMKRIKGGDYVPQKAEVQWLLDGVLTTKEELVNAGVISASESANDSPIFNVKLENIHYIKQNHKSK